MAPTLITQTNSTVTYAPETPTNGADVEHGVTGPTGVTGRPKRPKNLAIGTTVRPSKHAGGWQPKHPRNRRRR